MAAPAVSDAAIPPNARPYRRPLYLLDRSMSALEKCSSALGGGELNEAAAGPATAPPVAIKAAAIRTHRSLRASIASIVAAGPADAGAPERRYADKQTGRIFVEPTAENQPSARAGEGTGRAIRCPACDSMMSFAGGEATHDLYAERFVCPSCGHETYRSFGRGSVS